MEGLAGRLPRLVFLRSSELGAGVFNEVTYQDDIVEQLRRAATFSMIAGNRQMLEKAAAEIERLRLSSASAVSVAGNLRNGALSGCETAPNPDCRTPAITSGEEETMSNEKTNAEPSGASGGSMAWIPVTERLPNHGGTVVCRTRQRELQFGRVMTVTEYKGGVATDSHHWRGYPDAPLEVTHWTPLPAPPTEFECPANTQDQQPRAKEAADMSDTNERSVASAGSVAGEPVAWAALRDDGDIAWIGYTPDGAADGACGRKVVPLYRSPTLTDAERAAVKEASEFYIGTRTGVALRGLLERLR